jgi:MoaA/NifB/PqqE/SkfB family radical SAM enzyme
MSYLKDQVSRSLSALPLAGLLAVSILKLRTSKWKKHLKVVSKAASRGPPIAMWAITTRCNCKCYFCKVWRKPTIEPDLEHALETVDILDRLGCYSLSITGGEPLLYPYIAEVVNYAHKKGFIVQVNTNGSLLAEKAAKISDVDLVTISLDYPNEQHDLVRDHPHLFEKVLRGVEACKRLNLRVDLSALLLGNQEPKDLADFASNLNASLVLSYPEVGGSLHADSWDAPSREWLVECFRKTLDLKEKGYPVFNTVLGLRDAIQYLNYGTRSLPCFAGESIIYVDWEGWVYPCLHESRVCRIENLLDAYGTFPKFYACTKCFDQAWLDLSAIEWALSKPRPDRAFQDLRLIAKIALQMV